MSLTLQQLTLELFAKPAIDFAHYHPGPNTEAVEALRRWVDGTGPWFMCLWGGVGLGKSHLLQAAVRHAASLGRTTMYVPLVAVASHGPVILEGLEGIEFLCIDEVQRVAGQPVWEHALFDLFNRMQGDERRLLIASQPPPRGFGFALPDLASRLGSGLTYQLHELADDEKQHALHAAARRRGFELPETVAQLMLRRLPREIGQLLAALGRLDEASLSSGRQLTVPFAREVLGID